MRTGEPGERLYAAMGTGQVSWSGVSSSAMPGERISGFGLGRARPEMAVADLRCSFCGKPKSQVLKLIAGPSEAVAICNECVALCGEIIAEELTEDDPA